MYFFLANKYISSYILVNKFITAYIKWSVLNIKIFFIFVRSKPTVYKTT